ncbi:RNA polymerase sigma factor RpoE [Labilithrix luteola]|uniref:RNA polymerase sigma factor RpoE n=1 Tax=Labilithrix luteola TaxID=1391654 RepID=A0A0K1PMW1_9BACT|nr:sigma-70 family RNA polymerase sigma factor [Labilithrix luteola]AKU94868.1 RNA polymerase sigma factor RpoE [Labilithrix luteola]
MQRSPNRRDPVPESSSDAELLSAVARGDLGALGILFDRHHVDVWRFLGRYLGRTSEDVDDIVQQTFLELPKIAGAFDGRASCRSWLYGIALRLAFRRRRSLARLRRMVSKLTETSKTTAGPDPEAIAEGRQDLMAFERALGALGDKKRAAFVLVEIEGLSVDEAARALQIPAATVRTRTFHARQELRASMRKAGAL